MLFGTEFLWIAPAALLAAFVSAVAGAGLSVVLLPVLVVLLGIQEAVPINTICLLFAGVSRVVVNRRLVQLPVVGWFVVGAVPTALTGAYLFTITAPDILERILGVLLLSMVVGRRLLPRPQGRSFSPRWFLPLGAGFGFISGLMSGVGPLMAPFFLGYGLRKGAYVGTVGLLMLSMQISKLAVFGRQDFLTPTVLVYGVALAPILVVGTVLGKRAMTHISPRVFELIIEGLMLFAGIGFLYGV